MSRLPEAYEENTIAEMLPGDEGYTVPWAMWADEDRVLWINGKYSFTKNVFGTSHLRIKRTQAGVIVYQNSIGDHRYSPGRACYVGGADPLPVDLV